MGQQRCQLRPEALDHEVLQLRGQTKCCMGIVMGIMDATRFVPTRASSFRPMLRLRRKRASSFFTILRLRRRRAASVVRVHNARRQAVEPVVGRAPGSVELLGLEHRARVRPPVVYYRAGAAPVHTNHGHRLGTGLACTAPGLASCRSACACVSESAHSRYVRGGSNGSAEPDDLCVHGPLWSISLECRTASPS